MYFQLSTYQENQLLIQPETGMGYQVVEATRTGNYVLEKFLILNAQIVIEMDNDLNINIQNSIKLGFHEFRSTTRVILLNIISVLNEQQFNKVVNESKNESENGAIGNPVINANGSEIFVRLSAFEDDKRVDKINKCLRPGSFTTTMADYESCKNTKDDPVERYALPINDIIQFAFHIQPKSTDLLQQGTVQPANDKRGGGKEAYFANGTSVGTFINQTSY